MCSAEQLTVEIFGHFGVPADGQVVFSSSSVHYLSSHIRLTPQQFSELLEGAGGKQGHAVVYLLPIPQVQSEKLQPDFSCLSKLSESTQPPRTVDRHSDSSQTDSMDTLCSFPAVYAVDDPQNCVSLILDVRASPTLQMRTICLFLHNTPSLFPPSSPYFPLSRTNLQMR